jgi:hypothetical protein
MHQEEDAHLFRIAGIPSLLSLEIDVINLHSNTCITNCYYYCCYYRFCRVRFGFLVLLVLSAPTPFLVCGVCFLVFFLSPPAFFVVFFFCIEEAADFIDERDVCRVLVVKGGCIGSS